MRSSLKLRWEIGNRCKSMVSRYSRGAPKLALTQAIFAWMVIGLLGGLAALGDERPSVSHRVLLQGEPGLVIVEPDGDISWQMPWGGIHDIHWLGDGRILTRQGTAKVVEIDVTTKTIVWQYDSASQNGNAGKRVEVHAFERLSNGTTMIAESGPARLIEVDRDGTIIHEIKLVLDHPNPHSDTRLARRLENGNYLVAQEADGKVREYNPDGVVVWEYEVPMFGKSARRGHGPDAFGNRLFSAFRLPNGNTLIGGGNGHCVLEVTPAKEIVREIHQNDLSGIRLAWVTTVEVLDNDHWIIGNCHAGAGQPILIEVDPASKQVIWTLDRFDDFGNNVSNSTIIDAG
ncbi:outer membrane protein assembly factor BamB family protein [Aporhodopirellula aestuarii]|uniref:PQQ-like beta-propeller repeat protein n=1 Tax=Aporhodopirellula aestuarii TaxID=2950107 RepID=A0ABT0UCG2_9BACT|nr:PQQ-binding-like beta-propeller repeat protein [Aporhodopirellula aestuarii]MCM2374610.1 PQQ-like beta-propeller repeat protein [Aporhodopirellula aestuarii]